MFDWDEGDRFSFEDSERFEEDSLCSWMSEPESVCNNWRGWKRTNGSNNYNGHSAKSKDGQLLSLVELSAREVACHIPFEVVEHVYPPVPEQLQLRIAYWSFPENEEDIRLYSCLANGSADEFQRGENLLKARAVKDLLQIGFHLSATVVPPQSLGVSKGSYNVAVTFDRRRITSCNCTCNCPASWCSHVVSVCLFRIHQPNHVCLRAPVSESLSRLHRDQLQKFAQYLISELPQQILPTAQRLLDELLSSQQSAINTVCGAPDPTAGASAQEQTTWCLDESQLHENIRKILIKLCVPSPIVFSDVNYLSSTAPPAAAEWSSLLRPLRGREPEGMWNLLSIVREMLRRSDRNAIPLLEILTEEVLACDQIILWWFNTKVSLHAGINGHGNRASIHSNTHASQHACSSLCDEIVILWRLVALNPALSRNDGKTFFNQLHDWHIKTLERVLKMRNSTNNGGNSANGVKRSDIDIFPGFKPAMEGCLMDWSDYPVSGITYGITYNRWYFPTVHAHLGMNGNSVINTINTTDPSTSGISKCHSLSHARRGRSVDIGHCNLPSPTHCNDRKLVTTPISVPISAVSSLSVIHSSAQSCPNIKVNKLNDSNRSSLSSEGFCETENDQFEEPANIQSSTSVKVCRSSDIDRKTVLRQSSSESNDMNADENASDSCTENSLIFLENREISQKNAVSNKDECPDQSQSQQSPKVADEFELYYYDTKAPVSNDRVENSNSTPKHVNSNNSNTSGDATNDDANKLTVVVKKIEDPLEILFARAEALHAHGRTLEACHLAVKLAEELLANPPNLMVEIPCPPARGKRGRRFSPLCHQISLLASATLSKAAFLCSVLGENLDYHYLAFRVGLFGLEMARPPASTKALEVKLANQEQDLVALLKRIPLSAMKLQIVRERAEQLRDGQLSSRGEALLPLMLASYIFDALVLSPGQQSRSGSCTANFKLPTDERLGFEAAVAALGLKANVAEAEHPLLCEGTRRQRGELAITLLIHYKDDQEKLSKIMDKLLDKDMHQMFKTPPDSFCNSGSTTENGTPVASANTGTNVSKIPVESSNHKTEEKDGTLQTSNNEAEGGTALPNKETSERNGSEATSALSPNQKPVTKHGDRGDGASSPWDEDYKAWEARFRCTNFRTNKKHSVGMASVDSSAPETTSSDNSPTVVRRTMWMRPQGGGPGSDSGSSGESSDSFSSSSSGDKAIRAKGEIPAITSVTNLRLASCVTIDQVSSSITPRIASNPPPVTNTPSTNVIINNSIVVVPNATIKQTRFKGKRAYPSIPNQPSEASAHFMFELAKTVLVKAGGNSTTAVLFTQPSANQNCRGPHRALHMCAFQIGVYALGLHNAVSTNWLSRTYSSHVSWITGQAMEIGSSAINFLIDTWEGHLTPPEIASLADRASRGRDPAMVRAAAELALSCLPHAHALNPNEIQRALIQCKEQSNEMLERACLAVESAAKGGGVYPEVLFEVARKWFELYEESITERSSRNGVSQRHASRNNTNSDVNTNAAVVGEFQSITNSMSSSANAICIQDQQHLIPQAQAERVSQFDGIMAPPQPPPSSTITINGTSAAASVGLPLQVLPPLSCAPSAYALPPHPNTPYSFGYYPSVPAYPPPGPIPFQYISAAPTSCPYPYPFYSANAITTTAAAAALPHLRNVMTPVLFQSHQPMMPNVTQSTHSGIARPPIFAITATIPHPHQAMHVHSSVTLSAQPQQPLQQLNPRQLGYLLSAYRVGMLAMETLARRVHDDRPQAKYARNPSYGEDVKWLLSVAKKLGTSYLQDFCICTVNSVASPFVLHEIVIDTAQYLAHSSASPGMAHSIRSHLLTPLIQKCQQMFIACTHFKMYHITPADYDEFVGIIRSARSAFQLTPGGNIQFNELLQSLRRSKSCKKDLWQHIASSLQTSI